MKVMLDAGTQTQLACGQARPGIKSVGRFAVAQTVAMVVALLPVCLTGQWLDLRTPGIPRAADGKPNLLAPAPKTPQGKPDLSGQWRPETNPYYYDVIQDLKDEAIFRPAAEALFLKHIAEFRRDDPQTHCLPRGASDMLFAGQLYRIMQSETVIVLLYEGGENYRQIYIDGRKLPQDPNPTWRGYSIGHWEGDTLVVESSGFNDRTWLDRVGHPHSEALRVTERFRRGDFGHMQYQVTFDDPETLTRPLTISLKVNYAADTDMLENVCNENNRDSGHLGGEATERAKVSAAVLAKYEGRYEYREGVASDFLPRTQTVTLVNGQLFMNALPLVPQSEQLFETETARAEFITDSSGKATRLVLTTAGGDTRYDRER